MDEITEKTEASSLESDLEGEDFLRRLTVEERECLQYLLETIASLEDDDKDDDENANSGQDSSEEFARSLDSEREGNVGETLNSLNEGPIALDKTELDPSPTKMKIIKSFSEDCPGCSITVTPELAPRSTSSHPSHLRKFDTIMRSGVNVQELRARFINHQDNSSIDDTLDLSAASKQLPQVSRNQKSARQEALQKLGLLKKKQSNPNSLPDTHHGRDQSSVANNCELNQHLSWAGADSPHALEGAESPTPLPKYELLKF